MTVQRILILLIFCPLISCNSHHVLNSSESSCWMKTVNPERQLKSLICHGGSAFEVIQNIPLTTAKKITEIVLKDQYNLTTLQSSYFNHLPDLNFLTIVNSSLRSLRRGCFASVHHLISVNLSYNEFTAVHWRAVSGNLSSHIKALDIGGNPLLCGREIAWLHIYHQLKRNVIISDPVTSTEYNISLHEIYGIPEVQNIVNLQCQNALGDTYKVLGYQWTNKPEHKIKMEPTFLVVDTSTDELPKFFCRFRSPENNSEKGILGDLQIRHVSADLNEQILKSVELSHSGINELNFTISESSVTDSMGIYICEIVNTPFAMPAASFGMLAVNSLPAFTKVSQMPYTMSTQFLWYFVDVRGYPKPSLAISVPLHFQEYFTDIRPVRNTMDAFRGIWWIRVPADLYGLEKLTLVACNRNGCIKKHVRFRGPLVDLGAQKNRHVKIGQKTRDGLKGPVDPIEMPHSTIIILGCVFGAALLGSIAFYGYIFCSYWHARKHAAKNISAHNIKTTNDRANLKDLNPLMNGEHHKQFSGNNTQSTLVEATSLVLFAETEEDDCDMTKYLVLDENINRLQRNTGDDYAPWVSMASDLPVIDGTKLDLQRELGEGAFGRVFYGKWSRSVESNTEGQEQDETLEIAVKCMKQVSAELVKGFEQEALLLTKLDHEFIVKFFGISISSGGSNIYLVFEFMNGGDLRSFLISHGPNAQMSGIKLEYHLTVLELIRIAQQIAEGMIYLKSQRFVHRDLAARNCLVKRPLIIKLADFGMSRDIYTNDYYKMKKDTMLPLRWLAPESITLGRFTTETDVWSYGILLWEIFSYGMLPWCQYSNWEVIEVIRRGDKLPRPDECSEGIFKLMMECWKENPDQRISMDEAKMRLQGLEIAFDDVRVPVIRELIKIRSIPISMLPFNHYDDDTDCLRFTRLPQSVALSQSSWSDYRLKRSAPVPSLRRWITPDELYGNRTHEDTGVFCSGGFVDPFIPSVNARWNWPQSYLMPRRYAFSTPTNNSSYLYNPRLPDYDRYEPPYWRSSGWYNPYEPAPAPMRPEGQYAEGIRKIGDTDLYMLGNHWKTPSFYERRLTYD